MKISFIVPVYNVAPYLHECVRSISGQSYRDIEIILVDDGSKDDSPAICDAFADSDERVRVIHKENGGLSDARNAGLLAATGDYVVFVDGDDFWRDNSQLQVLVATAKDRSDCDFIGYNCSYYYPASNTYTAWVPYADELAKPTGRDEALQRLVQSGTFPMSACLKLIKREFLLKNNLMFVKGQIAEDIPWFINMLDKCEWCCFVNQYAYAYRQNVAGSITNTGGEKSFRSLLGIVKSEVEKADKRSFSQTAREALLSFLAYELCILLTYSNLSKEQKEELLSYSWLIDYDQNPKVRQVKRVKRIFGMRITVWLLNKYQNKRHNKK